MKKCKRCGKEKKKSSFYKCKNYPDGLDYYCKICKNDSQKKYRKNLPKSSTSTDRDLLMSGINKKDWCNTYRFLKHIGYDINGDIHKQFSEKYSLKYKKRPLRNNITFKPEDCSETLDKTDSLPD